MTARVESTALERAVDGHNVCVRLLHFSRRARLVFPPNAGQCRLRAALFPTKDTNIKIDENAKGFRLIVPQVAGLGAGRWDDRAEVTVKSEAYAALQAKFQAVAAPAKRLQKAKRAKTEVVADDDSNQGSAIL